MYYGNSMGQTVTVNDNTGSMVQGGTTGASIGGKICPGWGHVIGAAVGTVAGFITGKHDAKRARKAFNAQLAAANEANKYILQETARGLSEASRQRALLAMETSSALAATKRSATDANSEMKNVYASADQVGNAVAYATSEVDRQKDEALFTTGFNYETQQWNLNVSAQDSINRALSSYTGVNVQHNKTDWVNTLLGIGAVTGDVYKEYKGGSFKNNPFEGFFGKKQTPMKYGNHIAPVER